MKDVIVIIGAGMIGQVIARRVGAGKQIFTRDLSVRLLQHSKMQGLIS